MSVCNPAGALGRWPAAVLGAVLVVGGLASCSSDGPDATESTPSVPTNDISGSGVVADDVADPVFPGLGDPRIDVVSYDVTLRADPGADEISGTARLLLRSTVDEPLESFTLDLRGPEVTDAIVDGDPATVAILDDAEIAVSPLRSLAPRRDVEVVLTYSGEPDQTPLATLGIPIGLQRDDAGGWFTLSQPNGTSTWVPANDHPSDKATWRVTLDAPADAVGVASGRLADDQPATVDGRRRWVWEQEEPTATYLMLVAVGDYDLVPGDTPEIETLYALPAGSPGPVELGLGAHDDILEYFTEIFGPYPDDDSGAIVVPAELGLALEAQTRSIFSADVVGDGPVYVLAHELAHQWFGNSVTPQTWEDLWLNEGFATYAEWLWRDHAQIDSLDDRVASVAAARADSGLPVRDGAAAATFDLVIYEGGALTLHALRQEVGDETFFAILRRWATEGAGANVTTEDLVAVASDEADDDLGPFFARWLDEAPQPGFPPT